MATRVSEAEVRGIITTDKTDIDQFINLANLFVTNTLASSSLSAATLKAIEQLLAAHFIQLDDPNFASIVEDQVGASRVRMADAGFGEGLKSTRYGQQALALDTTGVLVALAKRKATFRVVEGVDC